MVIYFTEDELVSFGYYIMSKQRKDFFSNHPDFKDNVNERLQKVDSDDLANWAYIMQQNSANNGN